MKRYQPTTEEIDALFTIADYLHDVIEINNQYFYDEDTDDEQRKIIYNSTKEIYRSCLVIYNTNKLFPFG